MYTKRLLASVEKNNSIQTENEHDKIIESYEEYFTRTYLDNDPYKLVFFDSIYSLLLTGYVDPIILTSEIRVKSEKPEWQNAEEIITKYMEHDEETVRSNLYLVLSHAENGDYPALSYAFLYHWLSMFAINKVIRIRIISLLNKLKKGFLLSSNRNRIDYKSYDREFYSLPDGKNNPMSIFINKHIDSMSKIDEKKDSDEIFDSIGDVDKIMQYFDKHKHSCIFDKVDIKKLFVALKKADSRIVYKFRANLYRRYSFSNIYDFYLPEVDGISMLIGLLGNLRINKNKFPVRIMELNNLRNDLASILKRLKREV
jgi:hypothetical protein